MPKKKPLTVDKRKFALIKRVMKAEDRVTQLQKELAGVKEDLVMLEANTVAVPEEGTSEEAWLRVGPANIALMRKQHAELKLAALAFLPWLEEHFSTNDGCSGFASSGLGDPPRAMRQALRAALGKTPSPVSEENTLTIKVWAWDDAPPEFRALSTHGGDEDWVAFVSDEWLKKYHGSPSWMESGTRFGCCDCSEHQIQGGVVVIGAHA